MAALVVLGQVLTREVRLAADEAPRLQAIGFSKSQLLAEQVTRVVHWQATTFSLVPLALGVPLGLISGRLLFQTFANAVGTIPGASFPYALLGAVAAGTVALANAVATVPARRARRLAPAPLLAGE